MLLAFGILSWFVCPIFGILAWILGNADLAEMDSGVMDPEGRGMTQVGKILGMIDIILSICGMLLAFIVILLMIVNA
jgi:hypothetical protein